MNLPFGWRWLLRLLDLELTLPFSPSFAAEAPPGPSCLRNELIRPNTLDAPAADRFDRPPRSELSQPMLRVLVW